MGIGYDFNNFNVKCKDVQYSLVQEYATLQKFTFKHIYAFLLLS